MPAFIFETATTIDGYLADEQHSLDWLFAVPHDDIDLEGLASNMGTIVMGSSTWEWLLKHETLLDTPEKWSDAYADRPGFVLSSRAQPVPEGLDIRVRSGAVTELLPEIVEAAGDRDVWVMGGGDLVGQFYDAQALDRLQLTIAPVTLGSGAPLLPRRIESDVLHLVDVVKQGQFARLVYDVRRA